MIRKLAATSLVALALPLAATASASAPVTVLLREETSSYVAGLSYSTPVEFEALAVAYYDRLGDLCAKVMEVFAVALGLPQQHFAPHIDKHFSFLRYVYYPVVSRHAARRSALKHLVDTFFDGSPASAVTALLGPDGGNLSDEELDRIAGLIAAARKEPR